MIAQRGNAVQAKGVEATAAADAAMTGLLGKLLAISEAYPDLKADANERIGYAQNGFEIGLAIGAIAGSFAQVGRCAQNVYDPS